MKPCFTLILALALCLLLTSSYSIRIPRDPNPVETQVNNINIGGVEGSKDSEDCSSTSSSGNFRKLMTSTKSSPSAAPTTTSSKSLDKGANNVDPTAVKKSYGGQESETTSPERSQDMEYGDVITEMDYSPAKRKPPIHN